MWLHPGRASFLPVTPQAFMQGEISGEGSAERTQETEQEGRSHRAFPKMQELCKKAPGDVKLECKHQPRSLGASAPHFSLKGWIPLLFCRSLFGGALLRNRWHMGSSQPGVAHNNLFMLLSPKSMANTATAPASAPSLVPYSPDHKIVFYIDGHIKIWMDGSKPAFIAIWTPKN